MLFNKAVAIIEALKSRDGFFAGSFYWQFWIRDIAFSVNVLLKLGYEEQIKRFITKVLRTVRKNGEVPTLIPKFNLKRRFLSALSFNWLAYRRRFNRISMKLTSMWQPLTGDSNVCFLITLKEYVRFTGDEKFWKKNESSVERIISFIDRNRDEDGFVAGSGWLDSMHNYYWRKTFLLQVLLYRALKGLRDVRRLKRNLNKLFWDKELKRYVDIIGGTRVDVLAHAIALQENLIPEDRVKRVLNYLNVAKTPIGYVNLFPSLPPNVCGVARNAYQNSSIWPFVNYELACGMIAVGKRERATEVVKKVERLGFSEWYSVDGKSHGSPFMLWNAATYLKYRQVLS